MPSGRGPPAQPGLVSGLSAWPTDHAMARPSLGSRKCSADARVPSHSTDYLRHEASACSTCVPRSARPPRSASDAPPGRKEAAAGPGSGSSSHSRATRLMCDAERPTGSGGGVPPIAAPPPSESRMSLDCDPHRGRVLASAVPLVVVPDACGSISGIGPALGSFRMLTTREAPTGSGSPSILRLGSDLLLHRPRRRRASTRSSRRRPHPAARFRPPAENTAAASHPWRTALDYARDG